MGEGPSNATIGEWEPILIYFNFGHYPNTALGDNSKHQKLRDECKSQPVTKYTKKKKKNLNAIADRTRKQNATRNEVRRQQRTKTGEQLWETQLGH